MDAMRSLDVSPIVHNRMFPCHVTPVRLLVRFPFPLHMTITVLVCVMATHLDSSLSCLRFLAYASYSSPAMSTRLSPGLRYAHTLPRRLVS